MGLLENVRSILGYTDENRLQQLRKRREQTAKATDKRLEKLDLEIEKARTRTEVKGGVAEEVPPVEVAEPPAEVSTPRSRGRIIEKLGAEFRGRGFTPADMQILQARVEALEEEVRDRQRLVDRVREKGEVILRLEKRVVAAEADAEMQSKWRERERFRSMFMAPILKKTVKGYDFLVSFTSLNPFFAIDQTMSQRIRAAGRQFNMWGLIVSTYWMTLGVWATLFVLSLVFVSTLSFGWMIVVQLGILVLTYIFHRVTQGYAM